MIDYFLPLVDANAAFALSARVATLDHAKERIAYSKFWLGVMVVTNISVIGWLISAPESAELRIVVLAIVGVGLRKPDR